MLSNNMEIGSHGHSHTTFDKLSFDEQKNEIELSLQYLNGIKKTGSVESISYPYGRYNNLTIDILSSFGVKYGFKANEADYPVSQLEIPRLDTIYINHDKC
jgi:peptidoglycan/xylan/chitin deacetylase (PgdA/CDA1 family)